MRDRHTARNSHVPDIYPPPAVACLCAGIYTPSASTDIHAYRSSVEIHSPVSFSVLGPTVALNLTVYFTMFYVGFL
jgi:hypothetical protein